MGARHRRLLPSLLESRQQELQGPQRERLERNQQKSNSHAAREFAFPAGSPSPPGGQCADFLGLPGDGDLSVRKRTAVSRNRQRRRGLSLSCAAFGSWVVLLPLGIRILNGRQFSVVLVGFRARRLRCDSRTQPT